MRRFRYRMERLLRYRRHLEDEQRGHVINQESVVRDVAESSTALQRESWELRRQLALDQGQRVEGVVQHERYRYLLRVHEDMAKTHQLLLQETGELGKRKERLMEKSRDRKTLERLKEKSHEQWRQEMDREEQALTDEVASHTHRPRRPGEARNTESGKVILTSILLVFCIGAGIFCYMVWSSFLSQGHTGYSFLRAPFEILTQKKVREDLVVYQRQQRIRRDKLDEKLENRLEVKAEDEVSTTGMENERSIKRMQLREVQVRKKEEELDARENLILRNQEELKQGMTRLSNLRGYIDSEYKRVSELEEKRTREMTAERKRFISETVNSVKAMDPEAAATLLLGVAFPDLTNTQAAPRPVGHHFEEYELVIEVLHLLPSRTVGAIFGAMVELEEDNAAILFDMLSDVRTGHEAEQEGKTQDTVN